MVLLTGQAKKKTAVFISGTGSNLKNLIKFSLKKVSPIKVNLIISNNVKAKGLKFAKMYKIKKKVYNYDKKKTKLNSNSDVIFQLIRIDNLKF